MKLPLAALLALVAVASLAACSAPPDSQPTASEGSAVTLWPPRQIVGPQLNLGPVGPDGSFRVCNDGKEGAPGFRIAVDAGQNSYSIDAAPLAPGGHCETFILSSAAETCGAAILIIVDPQGLIAEWPSPGKHVDETYGYCGL